MSVAKNHRRGALPEAPRRDNGNTVEDQFPILVAQAGRFATAFRQHTAIPGENASVEMANRSGRQQLELETLAREAGTARGLIESLLLSGSDAIGLRPDADKVFTLGVALLDTLHDVIGDGFNEHARDAWSRVFVEVSDGL